MKFTKLLSVILACVMLMGVFTVLPVSAADDASIAIVYNNVTYGSQQKLMYAVSAPEGAEVNLVLCDAEGNEIKDAKYAGIADENQGAAAGCHVFLSDGMPAHKAADKVYAKAQLIEDGEVVEETELNEYSILEYLCKAMYIAKDQLSADHLAMCEAHYAFAVASQKALDAEATPIDSFVYVTVAENGTVGGKTAGMYDMGATIEGFVADLELANGDTVMWDFAIENVATGAKANETYTAEELADGFVAPNYAAIVVATPTLVAAPEWTLVTDVADLAAGDQIVIVAKGYNYALSTTQNNSNRGSALVTKNGDTVEFGDDVQIITLTAGSSDYSGTFGFNTGSGYLYAASTGSNHLKTKAQLDANGSWNITITSAGVATIKSAGNSSRGWLRFNNGNSPKLFSCYSSGQADIAIYKLG